MEEKIIIRDTRDKAGWNIASDHANLIKDLERKAVTHYLNGEMKEWFFTLTVIRELIHYGLKPEERVMMDKMEEDLGKIIVYINKSPRVQKIVGDAIKKYERKIIDFLHFLGYLPSKEDKTHMHF